MGPTVSAVTTWICLWDMKTAMNKGKQRRVTCSSRAVCTKQAEARLSSDVVCQFLLEDILVSGTDSLNSFSPLWFWFDILSNVNTFPILTCIYPNSACPSSSRYSSTMPFRLLRQQTLTLKPCSNIKSSTLKFLWLSQATDYLKWAQNRKMAHTSILGIRSTETAYYIFNG